jgi:ABC-type uncharacterized transport system permease subunit
MRVEIRSKRGNVAIGVLGVIYAISGFVLFIVHFMQTLGAASLTDRAIQILLIGVIALSIWFVAIAARGLGVHVRRSGTRETSPA